MRSTESRVKSTRRPWRVAIALLGAAALCAGIPAFAADVPSLGTNNNQPTAPGALSYVQGTVLLDGNPLNRSDIGNTELSTGEVLRTRTGKAEVMLDPGVYLRMNDHSAAKMLSMEITPTQVEVKHGEIGIEVDEIHSQNVLQVVDDGVTTQLLKRGYYEFNANSPKVKVFSGQAEVRTRHGAWERVTGRHELVLASGAQGKAQKFQPNAAEDPLMNWSKLRSQYLTEANPQSNPSYEGGPGWGWGPGWGMGWGMMGWGW